MPEFNGLAGSPEIWSVKDGDVRTWYVVYFVPGTDIPMAWEIPTQEDLQSFFGPGVTIQATRGTLSPTNWTNAGTLLMGTSTELANDTDEPWETFLSTYEKEAEIRPWLLDPEIMAIHAAALLEGRLPTDAELKTTDWWQSHTDAERQWLELFYSDPASADQLMADNRLLVADQLLQAGVSNAPTDLVNFLADQVTTGAWSTTYLGEQISKLASPLSPGTLDSSVQALLAGVDLDTNEARTQQVRDLVALWLGPAHAAGWSDTQINEWAAKLRDTPDGLDNLTSFLETQRMVLFPTYETPGTTYEDIASTWRNRWATLWGGLPDETSTLWDRAIRLNDMAEFDRLLRTEGIAQGNQTVIQSAALDLASSFGFR